MNYGLPYQGSKSKVCEWLFTHIPKTDTFYDVFAGGGAVTDYAIRHKWFQKYYVNDINPLMSKALQMYFTNGFANECRWISRDEFFKLKDTDPYVAICFSFGNDLRSYAYAEDVEPIKKAFHYAICFDDYSLLDEYLGEYKVRLKESSIFDRRIELQRYLTKLYRKGLKEIKDDLKLNIERTSTIPNVCNSVINLERRDRLIQSLKNDLKLHTDRSDGVCDTSTNLERLDRLQSLKEDLKLHTDRSDGVCNTCENIEKLDRLQSLKEDLHLWSDRSDGIYNSVQHIDRLKKLNRYEIENLERRDRLQELYKGTTISKGDIVRSIAQDLENHNRLKRGDIVTDNIAFTNSNYLDLEFEPNCIVYCDPPYKDTKDYSQNFTHEQFYDWCRNQKELTLISEYQMPDDFIKISEIKTKSSMSATATVDALERLYIPKHQKDLYYEKFHEDDW